MSQRRRLILAGSVAALALLLGALALRWDSGATSGPRSDAVVAAPPAGDGDPTTTTTIGTPSPAPPSGGERPSTEGGGRGSTTTSTSSSTTTTTTQVPPPPLPPRQEWGLPHGDLSINGEAERDVYNELRDGCADGELSLNSRWDEFASPRTDYLFVAAVQVCRGDMEGARETFHAGATTFEGWYADWAGVSGSVPVCFVYQAVVSVLEQIRQADVVCMGPEGTEGSPPWHEFPVCDRPTTTAVEVCPSTTTEDTTTTTTTSEGSG